ncbi:hypothetical protein [Maribacter sp. Asnod2-G09]
MPWKESTIMEQKIGNVFLGYFDEHVFRKKEQSVRLETNLV